MKDRCNLSERGSLPLERDLFNLRKMIVASSLDGVVYGLDSNDGAVVWKLQLSQVVPPRALKTALGKEKVILKFQQLCYRFYRFLVNTQ